MKTLFFAKLLALLCIVHPQAVSAQSLTEGDFSQVRPDHRIYLHYSESEIQDIRQHHPEKLKQLNYYFQHSWQVLENPNCESCPLPDLNAFDVQDYEHLRHPSRKNTVQLGLPGHFIVLMPRKALQDAYATLK